MPPFEIAFPGEEPPTEETYIRELALTTGNTIEECRRFCRRQSATRLHWMFTEIGEAIDEFAEREV